jgi:RNA ligase
MEFKQFTSIELLHNVIKKFTVKCNSFRVVYRPKIKLHGTNAGYVVNVAENNVVAMKRTGYITPKNDNFGYARWVAKNEKAILNSAFASRDEKIAFLIVWGEWCGGNVQKRVALEKLDKMFCPFQVNVKYADGSIEQFWDPEVIARYVPSCVKVLEYEDFTFSFNFSTGQPSPGSIDIDQLNSKVKAVDECDPWVKRHFDIDGIGEGFVFYPVEIFIDDKLCSLPDKQKYLFKAKGENHSVVVNKSNVITVAEKSPSIAAFVEKFQTPQRINQAIENTGPCCMASLGKFLKWIIADIAKESADELEISGLLWKDVSATITRNAKQLYINEINKIKNAV